ncbi:hypothetical protein B0H10DRAFT_2093875 [Mycena sp. CBHHK59/15]|nr:hypothetical protein B0H10DRAFT_2093875 [Mycena sp. CBHHK59/15]
MSSSRSSSTQSAHSSASRTSSASVSSSSIFSIPQTFTDSDGLPSPSAAPTDDSQGSGSGSGSPTLQSSASLYLYTFLATLVLLLGVSGAIVIRSLLLRRRHRRMVAEAIANGTWVDLRKKPRLWDAYLGSPPTGAVGEKEKEEWDAIMPFAASYTPAPSPELAEPEQPRVRVAVLIAMPARERSALYPSLTPNSASSPPNTATPSSANPLLHQHSEEEEEELPYLEVGLVHVGVVSAESPSEAESEGGHGKGKRVSREGEGSEGG